MAQRRPRRKSGAKIATKKEQAELLERARALAEDPTPLLPETTPTTNRIAKRLERRLQKISRNRDNERRLKGYLKRGPDLTRAYANLLLVAVSEKAGRMASTQTPVGTLKYAVRGMAPRDASVGVQHYRYPQVRVLAYRDIARKTNFIVWATPHGVTITGRKEPPPDTWHQTILENTSLPLKKHPQEASTFQCPHIANETQGSDRAPLHLETEIAAGPTRFQVCRHCIQDHLQGRDKALLPSVIALVIGLKPRHIDIHIHGTPKTCTHDGDCAWARHVPKVPESTLHAYREGRRSEMEVLERILPAWEDKVRQAGDRLFVTGDTCHGDDKQAFLDATGETGDRRAALERFLELGPHVVIAKDATMNHVLEALWDAAPQVLKELHPYPDELESLLKKHARSPPAAVIDEVLEARRAQDVLKGYPRYDTLPPAARNADRLARAHRTTGPPGMAATVEKELTTQDHHKGILWAALRITHQEEAHRWRFTKTDTEAGEFLEDPLKALLEANADEYHEKLAALHTLAGGQGELPNPVGKV
jgi:hypothetical protein